VQNLAGKDTVRNDKQILLELTRCGIAAEPFDCGSSEVQCTLRGRMGGTVFTRAWTYWIVSTHMPLNIAQRMYAHPVGVTDIRVAGHCGCPAPVDPWIEWRDLETDKKYAKTKDAADIVKFKTNYPEMFEKFMNEHIFHDDPASVGAVGTIDSYHIDSELGLYVFVQFHKGHL
jgi:hypothetical protein